MLAKVNRLSGKKNFERIKKEGRIFQSESFGLVFLSRNDSLPSRFGFVVSNKISKESTKRNRIKRAMREAVRMFLPNIKEDFDIVFLARQKLLGKSDKEISLEVKTAFERAGLIK